MNYLLRGQIASRLSGTYSALIACAFTYILTQGVIMIRRFVGALPLLLRCSFPLRPKPRVSLVASSGVHEMVKGRRGPAVRRST